MLISFFNVATTEQVYSEVHYNSDLNIKTYKVKEISQELKELTTNSLKQPSYNDLSLIQAAFDHPEIGGIITYDRDFKDAATSGLVNKISSNYECSFFVGNAKEFLKKYGRNYCF